MSVFSSQSLVAYSWGNYYWGDTRLEALEAGTKDLVMGNEPVETLISLSRIN